MMDRRRLLVGAACIVTGAGLPFPVPAQAAGTFGEPLAQAFAALEARSSGRLGVAILDTADGRFAGYRADERFPMCSTFKLLAVGYLLTRIDAGADSLDRRLRFARSDLMDWSPVSEKHVETGMTLGEICEAALTWSDNTAANLLLSVLGGPQAVTGFARRLGDPVTRLDRNEPDLNECRPGDPRDTTSPAAMLHDLRVLMARENPVLSDSGWSHLHDWLQRNRVGDKRLRAGVPAGWTVADKTGSGSGTANDVGLLHPPGGGAPLLIAAYFTQGPAAMARRELVLAETARLVVAAKGR